MSTDLLVGFDDFGIVEIIDDALLSVAAAGSYTPATTAASDQNANCINQGCGNDINGACYGSNTTCIAAANAFCGSNSFCSPK